MKVVKPANLTKRELKVNLTSPKSVLHLPLNLTKRELKVSNLGPATRSYATWNLTKRELKGYLGSRDVEPGAYESHEERIESSRSPNSSVSHTSQ